MCGAWSGGRGSLKPEQRNCSGTTDKILILQRFKKPSGQRLACKNEGFLFGVVVLEKFKQILVAKLEALVGRS